MMMTFAVGENEKMADYIDRQAALLAALKERSGGW